MKILVVEDDRTIAQTLELLLSEHNYAVDVAADGEAGLQLVEAFEYDLVMLDILLPKLNGIILCQQIRAKRLQMPILLLTGQGGGHQKAIALNAGADDYVVKPFDAEELMARVQALLRRGHSNHPLLTWGNLSLDPSSRRVTYGTHLLTLTPKEYAILELFLRNSQTILSARAILDHAWAATESPGDEAVRVHIKEMRQKLKAVGAPKDWIKTVHRVGYQLNPLYSSALATQAKGLPTVLEIAELKSVNEELRITLEELRLTEEELRHQNEELHLARLTIEQERQHYQDLFEFAPDGYLVTDIHGTIREANRAAIALLNDQYLIRKPLVVFIAKSDRTTFCNRLAGLEQVQNWEITLKPRHIEPFPVLISVTHITDSQNQIPQLRWSLRDIRERKHMEQQLQAAHDQLEQRVADRTTELVQANLLLQESEARLQRLASNVVGMLYQYVLRADGSEAFTYVSSRCRTIYELEPEVLQQDFSRVWAMIHPEDTVRVRQANLRSAQQLERFDIEFRLLPPSGCLRWVRAVSHPQRQANGDIVWDGLVLDITAQKATQADLEESEHRYMSLVKASPAGIFWFDATGQCTYVNDRWSQMSGRPPEAAMGTGWLQTLHPDDREPTILAWNQWIQSREVNSPHRSETRTIRPDGSIVWLYCLILPEIDSNGSLVGYIGSLTDITDRKQVEIELQQSEAKFRHFAENSHAVIWIAQPTSVDCLYVSPAYEKIWGRSRQNLIDHPDSWLNAVHPDDRDVVRTKLEQQRQGESSSVEYRIVRPDGSVRWIWDRGFAIRNEAGEIYRFGGIAEDITDRLRVEDDRKQAEQKIREQAALLDIASDAILVRDLNHHILYWNRGAERLYGWQPTEALGQSANELLQEDVSQIADIMQTLLNQGEWQGEIRKVTKTGREVISAGRWTLVRDNAGHPKFILTVNTDITEKKQLEAQFYRAQRLESLGTLASGIAHDLNNLLTPILAISQLMRQLQTNADARSQEMLKVLEDSARRGANMVQQILTFTRGSEGEHIPLHVADLLKEVITVVQQTFPRSISIHQDIPTSGLRLISADATQLHQVFMNLAVNARDAMPNGGVLRITAENIFLDDAFARMNLEAHPGSYIVVTVADTGTGIPPELLERIFDPFFTTKEVGKGTGLGLSTILGIVKNHGGFVEVCSKVGQGSQFKVYLPTITDTQDEGNTSDNTTQK